MNIGIRALAGGHGHLQGPAAGPPRAAGAQHVRGAVLRQAGLLRRVTGDSAGAQCNLLCNIMYHVVGLHITAIRCKMAVCYVKLDYNLLIVSVVVLPSRLHL